MTLRARDDTIRELLDMPVSDPCLLANNLRDIRRINALLGWTRMASAAVAAFAREAGLRDYTLLDVATGSADIPRAIVHRERRHGRHVTISASDVSPQVLAIAARACADEPAIRLECRDALALDYPDRSFDITTCMLALHHFAPDAAVTVLRELYRVAAIGIVVCDLERSWPAYAGARLLTTVAMRNPLTRHDAPASVRRAYRRDELRALAARAALSSPQVTSHIPFRLILTARRP
jgi:ubiquinone/menaquinone biosynthesis C-methylase UbiE